MPLKYWRLQNLVLREDGVLATGIKNRSSHFLRSKIEESVYKYVNWNDRYGHPSLAEGKKVYAAGHLCQRKGRLDVALYSGRYHRNDLSIEQIILLEQHCAAILLEAYSIQQSIYFYEISENEEEAEGDFFSFSALESDWEVRRELLEARCYRS